MSAVGQANRDAKPRRVRTCRGGCGDRTEAQAGVCRSCQRRGAYDPKDGLPPGEWVNSGGVLRFFPYGASA